MAETNPYAPGTPAYNNWIRNHPQTSPGTSAPNTGSPGTGGQDPYLSQFSDQPYYNTPGFQSLINGFIQQRSASTDARDWSPQQVKDMVSGYAQTFHDTFVNKVGAEPTAQDYSTFFQSYLTPSKPWMQQINPGQYQSDVGSAISNLFSGEAQDVAQKKAQALATQETAPGSAFDVWQGSYNKSIDDVQSQLLDFQNQLFQKIKPQLITSLSAQGLLNTGALNDALAGASSDLATTTGNYVAGLRGQAAKDIANQKYAIQSSPGQFALTNTFNTPQNLSQNGMTALQNLFQNEMQNNAIEAQNYRAGLNTSDQPSLLSQFGGRILGGVGAGLVSGFNPWAMAAGSTYGGRLANSYSGYPNTYA